MYHIYIHVDNSNFTSPIILPLIFGIMDTERVRFCSGPEVNFDFFYIPPPLGHLRWWRHRYLLREFHGKYRISRGKKLALITSGAIGLPKTKPDSTRSKKGKPDDPIFIKFLRRPAGRPDYLLSGPSPNSAWAREMRKLNQLVGWAAQLATPEHSYHGSWSTWST